VWDSKSCWFCLTKNPEYVAEYGEDGKHFPSFSVCRWCVRLLQSVTDDAFAISNKTPHKKFKTRAQRIERATEHAELLGEIEEFLNATT
jgi:hypothetical protein